MALGNLLSSLSRRDFFKLSSAGVLGTSMSGWMSVLAARAATENLKHKSCILLWMDGGPTHKDTFDLKPGTKDAGEFTPIQTSVNGVQISEHLPKVAKWMHEGAIMRSMSTGEGAHERARYNLHTGYRQMGAVVHPTLGSIVSAEDRKSTRLNSSH